MGKFYFAFAWDIIVNLHACICKNKICIWSDPGVNLPICKYTPVCICVRMRHLLTPSKICTPEYIYTCVFLAHANWTSVYFNSLIKPSIDATLQVSTESISIGKSQYTTKINKANELRVRKTTILVSNMV